MTDESITKIAAELGLTEAEVRGVADFLRTEDAYERTYGHARQVEPRDPNMGERE